MATDADRFAAQDTAHDMCEVNCGQYRLGVKCPVAVEPSLIYHPIPGAESFVLRRGVCCDNSSLVVFASDYQKYAECQNCKCRCVTIGEDDGQTTCWTHHDCSDGSCTHQDNDDNFMESEDEEDE